jgi:hypothetical protein
MYLDFHFMTDVEDGGHFLLETCISLLGAAAIRVRIHGVVQ